MNRVPAEFLREFGVVVGPLGLSQAEEARPWLHEGAYKAFFKLPYGVEAPVRCMLSQTNN
eukprot:7720-Eustigmatos_ZCMA.PRE.1